jgi:hypothetical protein
LQHLDDSSSKEFHSELFCKNGFCACTSFLSHSSPEELITKEWHDDTRFPAAIAAAVVLAPPWWTTAETRRKSQSCGTSPTRKTLLGSCCVPRPPQPLDTNALTPTSSMASNTVFVKVSGSPMTMEQNPTYMGTDPARRNAARDGSGAYSVA